MTPEFKKTLHVNYTFFIIIYLLVTDFVLSNRMKWFRSLAVWTLAFSSMSKLHSQNKKSISIRSSFQP